MDKWLERSINRYYDNAQFYLIDEDKDAIETIIQYAKNK